MDDEFNSGVTNDYEEDKWGWNIAYSYGQPQTCEVWAAVADECNLQGGVQVGTFEIDDCSVTWNFFDAYESNDFHFYAGPCEGSDDGAFLSNGGVCNTSNVKDNAAAPGSYPLQASIDLGALSTFSFSGCANSTEDTYLKTMPWGMLGFDVFPIGVSGRGYLTAHAMVCPVGVDRDVLPTQSPTDAPIHPPSRMPSSSPTRPPTLQPVATASPVTVDARSNQPVSVPASGPSKAPTDKPTAMPVSAPTSGLSQAQTDQPTPAPPTVFAKTSLPRRQTAYV